MSHWTKLAISAVAALILIAALPQTEAACGGNPLIRTRIGPGTEASFIFGSNWAHSYYPGYPPFGSQPPFTPNADATFWALGTGNPALGPGDDAGSWTAADNGWMYYNPSYYGGAYAAEIFTGWGASAAIDGCVQNQPVGACTCVLITDQDGPTGYFALVSDAGDAVWNFDLVQPGNDAAGNYNPIILQEIPQPLVLHVARHQLTNDIDATLLVQPITGPAQGIYQSGGSCDCGPTGYKIWQITLPRGSAPPDDRDLSLWSLPNLTGGAPQVGTALGNSLEIEVICGATNNDVYIATQLLFDSGFDADIVSASATRVECGSILAEPDRPRFRPGDQRLPRTPRTPERSR